MIILGIYGAFDWNANKSFNEYGNSTWVHESGATLFINGKHICSISEERLTRIKNDGNFPINSINYCLGVANIDYEQIQEIYIPSVSLSIFHLQMINGCIEEKIKLTFPKAKCKIISHHLCHAVSSIFSSDFTQGSFITLDGAGTQIYSLDGKNKEYLERSTIGYFNKLQNSLQLFPAISGSNRFGSLYHTNSYEIYCRKMRKNYDYFDEKLRESWDGKIMGLSAYGKAPDLEKCKYYSLSKDLAYEHYPYVMFSLNGEKTFYLNSAEKQAFLLQKTFEDALFDYLSELKNLNYIEKNVCFSGGCFLNVLANRKIKNLELNIFIPPFPNDTGLHFGAACYGAYKNKEKINLPQNIALLGKNYTNKEIEKSIKGFNYKKIDNFDEICEFTVGQLNQNKIIAWFQNRSEYGPRALGSRSILMSAKFKENKDILNKRVKHREEWRPFAGIILEEYLTDYFEEDFPSPYMLYSFTVKKEKVNEIPAITHIDNTCRIQTVNENMYPEITKLLKKYYELTNTPVILNTSFNDNGEPIVESPLDAIKAFNNLNIDFLVIGNYIVEKSTNKKNKLFVSYC